MVVENHGNTWRLRIQSLRILFSKLSARETTRYRPQHLIFMKGLALEFTDVVIEEHFSSKLLFLHICVSTETVEI